MDETDLPGVSACWLILTKGFLVTTTKDEMASLKQKGHTLCADFLDYRLRPELFEFIDLFIASSISQSVYLTDRCSAKPVHRITHHTDPRIQGLRAQNGSCRFGYFGELKNARYRCELGERIDFHETTPHKKNANWISHLSSYSTHYAVRHSHPQDEFKPFLKGFTAAECGANIITSIEENDVLAYLGPEYPYLLKDDSLESVLEMIDFTKESYGGPEWQAALEIMRTVRDRCSIKQVRQELVSLLSQEV